MPERRTPLFDIHVRMGAQMVRGGGDFMFPLSYISPIEEHINTRTRLGVQDLSTMGEVDIKGPGAERLINYLLVNETKDMEPGQVRYSSMCREDGGVVDDVTVYKFHDEHFMVVTSSGPRKKTARWIADHAVGTSTYVTDVTGAIVLLSVQGPRSREYLKTTIEVENGRVQAVITPQGRVVTERVLVCAGIWGPRIGRMVGVPIPLAPVEHQYVRTGPIPPLEGETREVAHPILRHQDKSMYFRQHADSYGIGSYQHEPLLVEPDDILSHKEAPVMPSITPFTEQHFEKAWASAVDLLPALQGADLVYKINGFFRLRPTASLSSVKHWTCVASG